MRQPLSSRVFLASLAVAMVPVGWSLFAQTPTSAVVAAFQIPDADIVGLSVGENGELAVYDSTPGVSNCLIRFYEASLVGGDPVVTQAPETVTLAGDPSNFKGWMVRDRGYLYALSGRNTNTDDWGSSTYERMWVYIISNRSYLTSINYNKTAEVEGDKPVFAPEDFRYWVNGFTIKPANAESGNNARLIIDDYIKGNLDILDLDSSGTAMVSQERHSYRDRYEDDCDWPDLSGSPWTCWSVPGLIGNSLALEWTLDTRSAPSDPSLATDDDLYIVDPIYSQSKLRRIKLSHPGAPIFSAIAQADIDLAVFDPFLTNGVEGLHAAPSTDRIWIATGLQSFDEGWVPVVDTLQLTGPIIDPVYSDENIILVDPLDDNHVIIPVADAFANPTGTLILRELQNGVVVNSVAALTGFDKYSLEAAAYDPLYGIVYLAIDDMLWAVEATSPALEIFSDGFESGNTSRWSSVAQ